MAKLIGNLAIICMAIVLTVTACGIGQTGSPSAGGYDKRVEILDVFCTYGESAEFPFRFTLKNLENEDTEVSYTWTLNDPQADEPEYEGRGSALLPTSEKKDIEIQVEVHRDYDPRFYVMYVYAYSDGKQVGYYRGQKSTYDWDYSVIPPVRRAGKPSYKHVWIDTFVEKTQSGYRVNIDGILFLPLERMARLALDNICLSGGRLLADMLVDNSDPDEAGFHDADSNGELTVGDYLVMNGSDRGKVIEFESRDEPSIRINHIGNWPETAEEENRDAFRIQNVDYRTLDERTIELEVVVASDKPPERVNAIFYSPGEGGVSSSGDRLGNPTVEGDYLLYQKAIETVIGDKGDLYLLIIVTDGANELLYNAGKLP